MMEDDSENHELSGLNVCILLNVNSNPELKITYITVHVIQEYLKQALKQMSLDDSLDNGFYMPHHAVIKTASSTIRVRVVFDA